MKPPRVPKGKLPFPSRPGEIIKVEPTVPPINIPKSICLDDWIDASLDRSIKSDGITVVITTHKRPKFLDECVKSVLWSGIQNIVITATGIDSELEKILDGLSDRFLVVKNQEGTTNNQAWLAGIRAVKTQYVIVLHDDDAATSNLYSGISSILKSHKIDLIFWDAAAHGNVPHGHRIKDLDVLAGIHSSSILRNAIANNERSLSPVRFCVRTKIAEMAFSEWESQGSPFGSYKVRSDFEVGNDLWFAWRCADLTEYFFYSTIPFTSCNHHEESATAVNISAGNNQFERMYADVKKRLLIRSPPKIGGIVHVFDESKCAQIIQNISSFNPGVDLFLMSECPITKKTNAEIVEIPPVQRTDAGYIGAMRMGTIMFLRMIQLAQQRGLEWFFCVEWDCRIFGHAWLKRLWEEHLDCGDVLMSGTPVCWHPWSNGGEFGKQVIEYASRYQDMSGMCMAFEGQHEGKTAVYPNGALAWYKTKTMTEMFSDGLKFRDLNTFCDRIEAYDLHIGREMIRRYGVGALDKIGILPGSYSGCGDHHYTLDTRRRLLSSGSKVAVHQIKDDWTHG